MTFLRIEPDYYSEFGVLENPSISDQINFLSGKVISASIPDPLSFTVTDPHGVKPGHFLGDEIPLISDKLLQGFRASGLDNFQAFPAILTGESGLSYDNYFAFNVVGLVDAVLEEESSAQTIMPDSAGQPLVDYSSLTFSRQKIGGLRMFRLIQSEMHIYMDAAILDNLPAPEGGWGISAQVIEVS